jgi:glycosyltransferase involved in cell wall biosynthesis
MISVIVPTFNREKMIVECVQSILEQSWPDIEVVVVDNLSTDDTVAQLQALNDPRIKVFVEPRRGATYARNTGIKKSTGDILAFLDSDDLWLPEKLALQHKKLEASAGEMVFTQYQEFSITQNISDHNVGVTGTTIYQRKKIEQSMSLSVITLMIRKTDFMKVGFFDENLKAGEFMEWYDRALGLGLRTVKVDQVLALRRLHEGNSAKNSRSAQDYIHACRSIIARRLNT